MTISFNSAEQFRFWCTNTFQLNTEHHQLFSQNGHNKDLDCFDHRKTILTENKQQHTNDKNINNQSSKPMLRKFLGDSEIRIAPTLLVEGYIKQESKRLKLLIPSDISGFIRSCYQSLKPKLFDRINDKLSISSLNNIHWELIYKGTKHGFDPCDFHNKCYSKPDSVVIITTTNNEIIGGYTSIGFKKSELNPQSPMHFKDSNAFLFNINHNDNDSINLFDLENDGSEDRALFFDPNFLFSFGVIGNDLHVSRNCCNPSNRNHTFKSNYKIPDNGGLLNIKNDQDLHSDFFQIPKGNFLVKEILVYTLNRH